MSLNLKVEKKHSIGVAHDVNLRAFEELLKGEWHMFTLKFLQTCILESFFCLVRTWTILKTKAIKISPKLNIRMVDFTTVFGNFCN